jgi:hypothetical protein
MAAAISTGSGPPTCCDGGRLTGASDHEVVLRALVMALQDARTAATQLAARFRTYAHAAGEPSGFARAAAVTAAAQVLGQAWLLIGGGQAAESEPATEQVARPPDPADQTEEIAQLLAGVWLLSGALSMLADRTGRLASETAQPLPGCLAGVQASLRAAGQQLAQAGEPAADRSPSHRQPPDEDPQQGTDPQ